MSRLTDEQIGDLAVQKADAAILAVALTELSNNLDNYSYNALRQRVTYLLSLATAINAVINPPR